MEEISIEGQIALPVGARVLNVDYVAWQGRCWLSPVYIQAPDGAVRPLRLIAPRWAPGIKPIPGAGPLEIFQQMPLTQAVLDQGYIPNDLAPLVEIVENPNVLIRNPPAR